MALDAATIKAHKRAYRTLHPEKDRAYCAKYQQENRDKILAHKLKYNKELFQKILNHYGQSCSICGEIEKLCVDHIGGWNGDGKYRSGPRLWIWIIQNNFPTGFRMLCHWCNVLDGYLRKNTRLGINGIDALIQLKRRFENG